MAKRDYAVNEICNSLGSKGIDNKKLVLLGESTDPERKILLAKFGIEA